MPFELYIKGSAPASTVPMATIQKRGLISLNRTAHAMIGDAEFVELLWDAERKIIGIRPTEATNPNAYPARPQNKNGKGPVLIAGTLFTQFIGIDTSQAMRWSPTEENGILCIDLSQPGHKATGNRRGSKKDQPEEGQVSAPLQGQSP